MVIFFDKKIKITQIFLKIFPKNKKIQKWIFLFLRCRYTEIKIIFHESPLECCETSNGVIMPIPIRRSINRSGLISPARKFRNFCILPKISIIKSFSHPKNSFAWRIKSYCSTTISISNISDIIWCFEIIPKSRL